MPYRNALRDNWQRYQDANDAEMRMYAQERAMSQPQGQYAAAEAGALSMDDIGYDAQGNLVILSREPMVYDENTRIPMPQMPQQVVDPYEGMNNIQRNRAELAKALQETY